VKEELQFILLSDPSIYQAEKQELEKLLDDADAFRKEMLSQNSSYMEILKEGARKEMEFENRLATYRFLKYDHLTTQPTTTPDLDHAMSNAAVGPPPPYNATEDAS
jgi:hypothetical protein